MAHTGQAPNIRNTFMSYDHARSYASRAILDIIPLDEETASEVVDYSLTLPNAEIESHLLGFLGQSEESLNVISRFLQLKREEDDRLRKLAEKKVKTKVSAQTQLDKKKSGPAWTSGEAEQQLKQHNGPRRQTKSMTVSEMVDMKPRNQLSSNQAKKNKKANLDSLKDIEAVLYELEVENSDQLASLENTSTVRRYCNCMATKHPLFEVAPNCLNCGKIICYKEGLQPCSFCGQELLTEKEKVEIAKILRSERDLLETKRKQPKNKSVQEQPSNLTPKKFKAIAGGNLWNFQDETLKNIENEVKKQRELEQEHQRKEQEKEEQLRELEHYQRSKHIDSDLQKAQEKLETLLHFQETGAERSKIIDNAADFEMPSASSGSIWLSPAERALQLKKQQKELRRMEGQKDALSGRSKKVVEMVIKDGKVTMVLKQIVDHESKEEEKEIDELEATLKQKKIDIETRLMSNTWDFESENDKWERPIYVSSKERQDFPEMDIPTRSKIQASAIDDAELVAALPS